MLIGAGQKALVTGDDQMWIFLAQLLDAKALLLQLPVAKIFQKYVGAGEQPVHEVAILGFLEIEHDASFAAIEQREERRAHTPQAAGLVAHRRLDLDDFSAELRQDQAAGRP